MFVLDVFEHFHIFIFMDFSIPSNTFALRG